MKILVADTSPVISLLLIRQFQLLEKLFEDIVIPAEVWNKLNQYGPHLIYKEELNFLSKTVIQPTTIESFPSIDKGRLRPLPCVSN